MILTQREDQRPWARQSASFPGTKSTFAIDKLHLAYRFYRSSLNVPMSTLKLRDTFGLKMTKDKI